MKNERFNSKERDSKYEGKEDSYKSSKRGSSSGKGKKAYSKRKNSYGKKPYENEKTDVTTGEPFREFKNSKAGTNDVQWYARNPQLLSDSASFSYNAALGSKLDWSSAIELGSPVQLIAYGSNYRWAFPGILAIHYANWCGSSDPNLGSHETSAINIAAENIYSFVRHANSGHANYDAPDLMMYLMAMDSLYSFIGWCRRLYGTARLFSQKNYYYQRLLTEVQGVDYPDLMQHLSDFRAYINTLSAKASAFAVPATMPIMQRHFFMASNVYKDHDTEKAQLYVFQPEGFHFYGVDSTLPTPYDTPFQLIFKPFAAWNAATTTPMSISSIMAYGESMISALLQSEDIGIMSGDILKAFSGNIFSIPATPEDYVVMPVYNPEVLSQIQNSRDVPDVVRDAIKSGYPTEWHRLDILQNPNTNKLVADFRSGVGTWITGITEYGDLVDAVNPIVSLNNEHPTPADTMIATRLTQSWILEYGDNTAVPSTANSNRWKCQACGTEVVLGYYLAEITGINNASIHIINPALAVDNGSQTIGTTVLKDMFALSNFDWHPFSTFGIYQRLSGTQSRITMIGYLGDIDTYRVFTAEELAKLDQTALLSLYGVPALGTY